MHIPPHTTTNVTTTYVPTLLGALLGPLQAILEPYAPRGPTGPPEAPHPEALKYLTYCIGVYQNGMSLEAALTAFMRGGILVTALPPNHHVVLCEHLANLKEWAMLCHGCTAVMCHQNTSGLSAGMRNCVAFAK